MNTTILPEFEAALKSHTLALFLGADLPREVTGLPSRADLARDMARRYHLDESLSLAEVAQRVSQAGNRFEFTDFIRNELDTTGKPLSAFHQGIVGLVKEKGISTVITTAYDNLLEVAFQQVSAGINRVVRGSDVSFIRPDRPTLIKLYGDAQQLDTLVVTDRDHSQLLRDRDKEDVIAEVRQAFKRNTILFYGYNLSDPDFKFLFDQIAESKFARLAYAVWPGLLEADKQMWRDRGIVILEKDPLEALSGSTVEASTATPPPTTTLPVGSSSSVPTATPPKPSVRPVDTTDAAALPSEPSAPRTPRRAWWALAFLLLLIDIVLAALVGWRLLRGQPDLVAYIQTFVTALGLPLAIMAIVVTVLAIIVVARRKVVWEDFWPHLVSRFFWPTIVIELAIGVIMLAFLIWPTSVARKSGDTQVREIDGMIMVYVEGGSFQMGSDTGNDNEKPAHDAVLDSYWIDRFEVTNAQYAQCVAAKKCLEPSEKNSNTRDLYYGNSAFASFPVINVNWEDAGKYCEWVGGQLPTEEQWEYAARGSRSSIYPWGNNQPDDEMLNYNRKIGGTTAVGSFPRGASWVGAFDMAGNVWEWVQDWYAPYQIVGSITAQPDDTDKVLRGASWYDVKAAVRASARYYYAPDKYRDNFGFRCVVPVETTSSSAKSSVSQSPTTAPVTAPTLAARSLLTRTIDAMTMVYIPGDTFQMGSTAAEIKDVFELCKNLDSSCTENVYETEAPLHTVALTGFWMDRTEVTNAQYQLCVDSGQCARSLFADNVNFNQGDYPVVGVSWFDALQYCTWVSATLPTEAQWEYAARGKERWVYPWGNDFDGIKLNFCDATCAQDTKRYMLYHDEYAYTAPVTAFPDGVSWSGVLNMSGNVWEWTNDWYRPYSPATQTDPTGPSEPMTGTGKVIRGGSWINGPLWARAARRGNPLPEEKADFVGFRCVSNTVPLGK